ncbi:MAG: hypothetical protein ACK58T_31375, partial [Phycisphaerae bacterium]
SMASEPQNLLGADLTYFKKMRREGDFFYWHLMESTHLQAGRNNATKMRKAKARYINSYY